jgi:hypothetical protein
MSGTAHGRLKLDRLMYHLGQEHVSEFHVTPAIAVPGARCCATRDLRAHPGAHPWDRLCRRMPPPAYLLLRFRARIRGEHAAFLSSQEIFFAAGGVHVPLMSDGDCSLGQYMRNIKMNFPAGAGSQFDSLSAPGVWF